MQPTTPESEHKIQYFRPDRGWVMNESEHRDRQLSIFS